MHNPKQKDNAYYIKHNGQYGTIFKNAKSANKVTATNNQQIPLSNVAIENILMSFYSFSLNCLIIYHKIMIIQRLTKFLLMSGIADVRLILKVFTIIKKYSLMFRLVFDIIHRTLGDKYVW